MARVNIKPDDRKKEIEEVKKKESIEKKIKFGQEVNSQYAGKKELPVKEPFPVDPKA